MITLREKTALVTGSSAGIGKEIACLFGRLGAHVIVTSRTNARAEKVAEEIREAGGRATATVFDLGDSATIPALLATAADISSGRLDILVNNALSRPSIAPLSLQNMDYSQLQDGVTANLTNVLALTSQAYPYLKAARGVVLNIGSAVINRHTLGIALYTILKGALGQTTKVLAAEWAADGIRVNQINPGFIPTDSLAARQSAENAAMIIEQFTKLHPLGRVGKVEDVAALSAFLVSEQAAWITGALVDIDGGFSVQGAMFPSAG